MKLVKITWWDHSSYSTQCWRSRAEVEELKPLKVHTVGYVVKETKRYITLVNTWVADDEELRGELCIIKSCIKRIRRVG